MDVFWQLVFVDLDKRIHCTYSDDGTRQVAEIERWNIEIFYRHVFRVVWRQLKRTTNCEWTSTLDRRNESSSRRCSISRSVHTYIYISPCDRRSRRRSNVFPFVLPKHVSGNKVRAFRTDYTAISAILRVSCPFVIRSRYSLVHHLDEYFIGNEGDLGERS